MPLCGGPAEKREKKKTQLMAVNPLTRAGTPPVVVKQWEPEEKGGPLIKQPISKHSYPAERKKERRGPLSEPLLFC